MKLESQESVLALTNYDTKNKMEQIAIKVLLSKSEDVVKIKEVLELDDDQLDELCIIIINIQKELGIDIE